jgi:hypothetical protein
LPGDKKYKTFYLLTRSLKPALTTTNKKRAVIYLNLLYWEKTKGRKNLA